MRLNLTVRLKILSTVTQNKWVLKLQKDQLKTIGLILQFLCQLQKLIYIQFAQIHEVFPI